MCKLKALNFIFKELEYQNAYEYETEGESDPKTSFVHNTLKNLDPPTAEAVDLVLSMIYDHGYNAGVRREKKDAH